MHNTPLRIALFASFFLAACKAPAPDIHKYTFFTMGTQIEVSLVDADKARADRVENGIEADFQRWNLAWNPWGDGALGQLNRAMKNSDPAVVDVELAALLSGARDASMRSGGFFNPAVGNLVKIWGFDKADEQLPKGPPPSPQIIKKWRQRSDDIRNFSFIDYRLSGFSPGVSLDFGGYAKGFAVDKTIDHLRQQGMRHAIVNAGGDLRVLGRKGDKAWTIGIRDPRGQGVFASLEAEDGDAIFTSGDYERFYDFQGRRYHHIFDPRTGFPTEGTSSVTVVTDSGAYADACATALMVAGPKDWRKVIKDLSLDKVMLISSDGTVYITPALYKRMRFAQPPAKVVIAEHDGN